ncbi:shikimate dehydrogenase [Helicobacter turcicus]|uniref:Shikimate dehydrogenase (NADP(+)) n=1 Tax=Helicobacter turcicus TaxID=2867412 RepID=A0ABS7JNQ4_9HELI|nr:shikimate dehydrogenase [Helicobacter turcicus]MBX7491039.1 shikimate dehydrogenase [Helicobacter turcicus]MBX7546300.1 shikimate dehydrogenase [Helicobacter turcicus]
MQFAVIGNPIAHSLSPILHNHAFSSLGIAGFYGRYLLQENQSFYHLRSLHLKGANITVPFKEIAFNSCDEAFGIAYEIRAINTIVFEKGKMLGYNTDALGFYLCIENLALKNALIIGAGGSAKAVAHILKQKGISVTLINRSKERLRDFCDFECATFDTFTPKNTYDLIINTTPAGLTNNDLPLKKEFLSPLLKSASLAFDLIYGRETPFLTLAKSLDIATSDGKAMLINQAILAFEIFMESQNIAFDPKILRQSMQNIL